MSKTIWSGRFSKSADQLMKDFSVSLPFDRLLFDADIQVNRQWARSLQEAQVYTAEEVEQVERELEAIALDFHRGNLDFSPDDEDIHSATERWLTARLGALGERIHTGRSRNDQVVTDFKIYLREKIQDLHKQVVGLQTVLLERAEEHENTVMPGYTHVRQAQPISFAHYLLSFFFQLQRDGNRITDWRTNHNICPLGSGALAGSAFAVDRQRLALALGFDTASDNSIDATGDRDFVLDCTSLCVQIMLHLSRLSEDWIYWSSEAYGFLAIDQAYGTGSSMMPQKMNPDSLELIRGKTARVIGAHSTLMSLIKGIPTAYVRDLQEDKEPAFDALHQTELSLRILAGVVKTAEIDVQRMRLALHPSVYATDMADYLVRKQVPFRQAHEIVGKIVAWSEGNDKPLDQLSLAEFKQFNANFAADVLDLFKPHHALSHRNIAGGTGPQSVRRQIEKARQLLTSVG